MRIDVVTSFFARTNRLICCFLWLLACVSCERKSHFVFWHDLDHFCDGKTFSCIVDREDGVQAVRFMEHGSGYRAASTLDGWLVQWRIDDLKEGQTNYPANVIYLGRHEVARERGRMTEKESGVNTGNFHSGSATDYVLGEARMMELFRISGKIRGELVGSIETGGAEPVVFTRSRQHFFTWKPFSAIYASSNLSVVRKISLTEQFNEFEKVFHGAENHLAVLTDDLKYLISVPHNGGESPQGVNHYKAHCFDFTSDSLATKMIRFGTNDTAISAIENVNDQLLFIAYSDSEELALLNGESKVLAELPSEGTRFFNFSSNFHWDYTKHRVFISESKIDLNQPQREIVLNEHSYDAGQGKRFVLNAGEMQIPKAKP